MSRRKNKKEQSIYQLLISAIVIICLAVSGYYGTQKVEENKNTESNIVKTEVQTTSALFDLSTIPEYQGNPYIEINNNIPYFKEEDYTTESFERYSEWDELGRSGMAFANICKEVMPPEGEERGEIGIIKDLSGWVQKRYDNLIKDKYLYNRCHLIGWQLEGNNKLASGVQMEAWSVEDNGQGICFNVYCYNVQPGIIIDYSTGESQENF